MQKLWTLYKLLPLLIGLSGFLSIQSCSVIFPIIAPFADLPEPTGPYSVVTRTSCWTDSTHDETFTPEPDYRRIVVQVWYPTATPETGTPTLYIDNPKLRLPALSKQLRLPVSLFRHFDKVRTNSYSGVKDEDFAPEFPVILFSHGLSGMRFQNTALMEELASQGYVVFAADHSYAANITIFPNGDIAQYRAGKRRITKGSQLENIDLSQLAILVNDLRFMADMICENRDDPLLKDLPYDDSRLGLVGHSIGGAAILNALAVDGRFQAAMVLDGWYIPVPDSILASGVHQPIFHLGQKEWVDRSNYQLMDQLFMHSDGPAYQLLLPHTQHTDFTDMPLFTPFSLFIGYTETLDPIQTNSLIRRNTVSFFNTYLKNEDPQKLNAAILSEPGVNSYIFSP